MRVVNAAVEDGDDADKRPHYPSNYDLPNVLSVAALTRSDQLAGFSNYGAKTVHLAAPGAEILSTWLREGFEEHSGTSMATPVVSGVAALVLAAEPDLSVTELRQRLLDTVDKLDALRGRVASGGRVNAARAVTAGNLRLEACKKQRGRGRLRSNLTRPRPLLIFVTGSLVATNCRGRDKPCPYNLHAPAVAFNKPPVSSL